MTSDETPEPSTGSTGSTGSATGSPAPAGEPIVVGRIGRAHGVRGAVTVSVRTDDPDTRFAPGTVIATDPPESGPLTVAEARWHSGQLLLTFEGVRDRSDAEALRGILLIVDITELPALEDPEEFYDHELTGMTAFLPGGELAGEVVDVVHAPAGDLLVLRRPDSGEALVPFVRAIVPTIDRAAGRIELDPPDGLFDL